MGSAPSVSCGAGRFFIAAMVSRGGVFVKRHFMESKARLGDHTAAKEENAWTAMAFRRALLAWYDREKRELPWRGTRDPYRVWLSEIMLQQTRAEAVAPRYEAFLPASPPWRRWRRRTRRPF